MNPKSKDENQTSQQKFNPGGHQALMEKVMDKMHSDAYDELEDTKMKEAKKKEQTKTAIIKSQLSDMKKALVSQNLS
jgi:hypothetical protein